MSNRKVLVRNISSNLSGYSLNLVVGLLLSPFVVSSLGDGFFGVWTLIRSLTGYYGVLDFGLLGAVSHYVTRYITKSDVQGVNRTISTAMGILAGVALVATFFTLIFSFSSQQWFSERGFHSTDLQWALVITGLSVSLNLPLVLFRAIPYSLQRLDILNMVGIGTKLLEAGLTVLVLNAGYGILGITIVYAVTSAIAWGAHIYLAYSLYPALSISLTTFSSSSLKELFGFGLWSTIINTAEKTVFFSDSLLVGFFLTVEAVTYYAIGGNLVPYYLALIQAITWAITPLATARNAQGDEAALRQILLIGTGGTVALGTIVGAGMILLGNDFLSLWMGEKYVSGMTYTSSASILTILTLATFLRIIQSCGFQILFGMGKVKYLAFLAILEILVNLILSILFIKFFGLIGVAFGTLIAAILVRGFLQPRYVLKVTKVSLWNYLSQIGLASIPIITVMVFVNWLMATFQHIAGWTDFLIRALGVAVPALLVGLYTSVPIGVRDQGRLLLLGKLGFLKKSEETF